MKSLTKFLLVAAGYLAAWLVASWALAVHQEATAADSVGADGMYAFGDSLLFLMVFGFLALFPTGAAVYFLRSRKSKRA